MNPFLNCKCGMIFDTKGMAAGKTLPCPSCQRTLVVSGAAKPPATAAISRKIWVAGIAATIAVGAVAGLSFAVYQGVLDGSAKKTETAVVVPTSKQPATRNYVVDPSRPTSAETASYSPSTNSMLPANPIENETGFDGTRMPPR